MVRRARNAELEVAGELEIRQDVLGRRRIEGRIERRRRGRESSGCWRRRGREGRLLGSTELRGGLVSARNGMISTQKRVKIRAQRIDAPPDPIVVQVLCQRNQD